MSQLYNAHLNFMIRADDMLDADELLDIAAETVEELTGVASVVEIRLEESITLND